MTQPSAGHETPETPPSFIPSGASRRSARHAAPAETAHDRAPGAFPTGASVPPSFSPAAASPSPARAARRTSRSVGTSVPAAHEAAPIAATSAMPAIATRPAIQQTHAGNGAAAAAATTRRRRRGPAHRGLTILLVIVLVAAFGAFSLWGWVNGQLVRQNMLTGASNTPAQTWLLLGSDERDAGDGTGIDDGTVGFRTDTILVLTKPKSGNSSLISIPRDSLVDVNGKKMKINATAAAAGYPALVGQIEKITGLNVDHVAVIRFGGLQNVVDALGGVELCYDRTVNDVKSNLNWQAGCHVADGATALAFSRMRYSDPKGDFGRAERQRQVIAAITKKAASGDTLTNFGKVQSLMKAGLGSLTVDEKSNAWNLAQMAMAFKDASGDKGVTGTVYWTNADYRAAGVGSSVLLDDARNTQLFTELGAGTHAPGTVGSL